MKKKKVTFLVILEILVSVLTPTLHENLFSQQAELPISPTNRSEAKTALIPYPRNVKWLDQDLALTSVFISMPGNGGEKFRFIETTLRDILSDAGVRMIEKSGADAACAIRLKLAPVDNPRNSKEAYRLKADEKGVEIAAPASAGLFYGVQTLRQLMMKKNGKVFIAGCKITDWPEFRYRGMMHDVGRNFQTIAFLKKQMDILARYKMNVFHWHLTDHPAWRVESILYPRLNAAENHRSTRNPGKFYTYADMNEFKQYCAERNILIIPELDMPGHSTAFTTAMKTEMQSPQGLQYLQQIITEFCDHFDVPVVHIGSDEVHIKNPEFIPTIIALLQKRGKNVVVWRPGGPIPNKRVITQLWTGNVHGLPGVRVIDSQNTYVNHMDPLTGIHRLFVMKPCKNVPDKKLSLGGILCIWPDTNIEQEENTLRQNPVLPAILTYAERIWRGAENDHPNLYARMSEPGTTTFKEFTEFERDLIAHRDRFFPRWPFPYVKQTDIRWRLIGPFDNQNDCDRAFGPEKEIKEQYRVNGRLYEWQRQAAIGGTVYLNHFFGWHGYMPKTKQGTVYALTYLFSPKEGETAFWIQFGTPSTSSRRIGGNPPAGKWNVLDGKIWVNGREIEPPVWKNPGPMGKNVREIPFTNEAYFYRQPTMVKLKKGWNRILLRAPIGEEPEGYRKGGTKWMFTCVPIDWDGKRARELTGIRFATKK